MKTIPRYWAFAPTQEGFLLWRSSPDSEAAARDLARQAADRVSRFEQGDIVEAEKYPYGVTLREKLLGEIDDVRGQLQGFITRNTNGSEVLNVKNVMFLDWDTPETRKTTFFPDFFRRLFRQIFSKESHYAIAELSDWPSEPTPGFWRERYPWTADIPELKAFMPKVDRMPDWGVRVYKTCAGYRGLVTHATFDPTADATLDLMRQFRCDPQYVALCKRQESFRARLTPKGWRCKLWGKQLPSSFKFRYPYSGHGSDLVWKTSDEAAETQRVQAALAKYDVIYDNAVAAYEQATVGYATCRYLGTVGNGNIHPDIASIVALHDESTHALAETEMILA